MEDDDQDDKVEVMNDEEDDNEEGVLMDTPIGHETVLLGRAAVPQLAQHDDDDDTVCFHGTECNITLANLQNFKKHQQSKRHQSKVDAGKSVSSSEHHCDVCNASFKNSKALKGHEKTMKHQDNVDPEGAEPRKKARVVEAQAKLAKALH